MRRLSAVLKWVGPIGVRHGSHCRFVVHHAIAQHRFTLDGRDPAGVLAPLVLEPRKLRADGDLPNQDGCLLGATFGSVQR